MRNGKQKKGFIFLWKIVIIASMLSVLFMLKKEIPIGKDIITWHDRAFEIAAKRALHLLPDTDMTIDIASKKSYEVMFEIMELEGKDIKSIEDIKYFKNLNRLSIKNTSVSDLSPLESTKLQKLIIDGGNVTDLEAVGELENLIELELYNIPVEDLAPLSKLKNLVTLKIGGLPIDDLSILGQLKQLEKLSLSHLQLKDDSVFNDFETCKSVFISDTNIKNLSGLKSVWSLEIKNTPIDVMPNLTESLELLYLENTNIKDLSNLPSTTRNIKLVNNEIKDLNPLCSLENLKEVKIYDTDLSEIEPFRFHNLDALILENCNLSDMSFLKSGTNITSLSLPKNHIKDINKLDESISIGGLRLPENQLQSLGGIERLTKLEALFLDGNQIENVRGLENLTELRTLDLSKNYINDISGIEQLTSLAYLDLSDNQLQNVDNIGQLWRLDVLKLSRNPIKSVEFLNQINVHELHLSEVDLKNFMSEKILSVSRVMQLYISGCGLSNIDFLKKYTELTVLDISDNKISDLSVLNELDKISELNLSYNPITDLSQLSNVGYLDRINISGIDLNKVAGANTIGQQVRSTYIIAQNCNLKNLEPLAQLAKISFLELDVSKNQIDDLSIMVNMPWKVSDVNISENLIDESYMEYLGALQLSPGIYQIPPDYRACVKIYD